MATMATLPNPAGSDPGTCERLVSEGLIPLSEAARLLPNSHGKPVSVQTIVRWIRHGKNGVKLEATRAAGEHWWTSKAAVGRFLAGLTRSQEGRARS